jgi:hypothetical protein
VVAFSYALKRAPNSHLIIANDSGGVWCSFESLIKEVENVNYVLSCEKCKRPAQLINTSTSWKEGQRIVKKVYEKQCPCGGKIKVMMD